MIKASKLVQLMFTVFPTDIKFHKCTEEEVLSVCAPSLLYICICSGLKVNKQKRKIQFFFVFVHTDVLEVCLFFSLFKFVCFLSKEETMKSLVRLSEEKFHFVILNLNSIEDMEDIS